MNEKGNGFFCVVVCIIICIVSIVSIIYAYKAAAINDKNHVIYKNYDTKVEFSNGSQVELNSKTLASDYEKTITVINTGEDKIYLDIIWQTLDLNGKEDSFVYSIEGISANKASSPSSKESNVPLTTSEGILMGETIMPGDVVNYKITFKKGTSEEENDKLFAKIATKIRLQGGNTNE